MPKDTLELIDSHTHLTASDFDNDREQVIERALSAGITTLVTIGAAYGSESAKLAIELARRHKCVKATVGIHPHDAKVDLSFLDELKELALDPEVVAIGETGLDFYRDWSPIDLQEIWFRKQIELALNVKKPLIIHSRDAGLQCFNILTEMHAKEVGGVFHCFSENLEFARKLEDINFILSVPGSVTFKKATILQEVVKNIPLSRIMLETDAPFIAPVPYRGKRCESSFMLETAKFVADIKGMSLLEVARQTTETARKFFRIQAT